MSKVLFEITEDQLETGLRGFPVGYCTTSSVDPTKGLFYVGRPVPELAHLRPEEVIYLLYNGREGSKEEIQEFSKQLQARSRCSEELIQAIRKLPRHGHAMKLFTCAILLCGMIEGKDDYREDTLNLIAKLPELTATVINHHAGWQGRPAKPELGYIENFCHMLGVPNVKPEDLYEVMRLFNVLHFDHGGGNLSTFVGKAVASGLADLYDSIASAMCALAGPRHGRANQDCLEFVQFVLGEVGENATEEQVENLLRERLDHHQLVFGFGHAVLRVEDPRAQVLYEVASRKFSNNPLVKIATLLRTAGHKVLSENAKITDPYANVDAISGTVLSAAGFNYPQYFTVLFGLSRCVGISIQIIYERLIARDGKGTPIVRPKYIYKEALKESGVR